ncbi:hypothetical protein V6Z11_A03G037900 [Gossypium hirsutum]
MASSFGVLFVVVVWMMMGSSSYAQLSTKFYSKSCPKVLSTVELVVKTAVSKEQRLGASLLRLFFHDCFVNGCDGSVLLDDTSSFTEEQTATPNNGSLRGFEVVDEIKAKVEKVCPGVVSCADILAIAARDSVVILGGPDWDVKLGRRDSKTASFSDANSGVLPLGSANLSQLISLFQAQGLSTRDMVALSGARTIGKARCLVFRNRIYNETNIDTSFAKTRRNQELFNGGSTDSLVKTYSSNVKKFYSDFVAAIIKMGDIKPLTGSKGEIRKNCGKPN